MNNLNTTNLAYMDSMFISCYKLTSLNLNSFSNTHNIVDISFTFAQCKELQNLDINNWNTTKIEKMVGTFMGCISLKS